METTFIGVGSMTKAILRGVFEKRELKGSFYMNKNPNIEIEEEFGFKFADLKNTQNEFPKNWFLGIKPQNLVEIAHLKSYRPKSIVSILAGVQLKNLEEIFETKNSLRIMPSLTIENKKSITLFYGAQSNLLNHWKTLFERSSKVIVCETEEEFDRMMILTASMPGIFSHFLDLCTKFQTIEKNDLIFVFEEILNSLRKEEFDSLKKRVSSKGGITEAVTTSFPDDEILRSFQNGIQRSESLSKIIMQSVIENSKTHQ